MNGPQTDLSGVLRAWRMHRDISEIPGIEKTPASMRKSGVLTQALMAVLLGVGERHYRSLERGDRAVGRDLIARCVEILALNTEEADTLYVWCGHSPPPPLSRIREDEIPKELLDFMHTIGSGAYWTDDTYRVLAHNRRAAWHWPWMQRDNVNVMTELLSADSQGRRQCLDWESEWAPRLVAQIRRAAVVEPKNARLQKIVRQVRENPEVEYLWDTDARATVAIHAYGTVRPMRLPLLSTAGVSVSIQALVPMARTDLRLVTGILMDAEEPPLPQGPPPPPVPVAPRP